ncbi:ClpP/crotonase-like domain-containing protein [Tricharina praecox]|uniref:ClpP/crotonase-like domain-containing protein n=1 Tax=Tricharina praecox TaxID=43433 RepID=UPI00222026D3|nr:ClpP/crotonase-like domain-containing protein [Tricharina praecox]KAI5855491.1 ClpP/crotonase-like domain-containing protein [Tricharina praecox]
MRPPTVLRLSRALNGSRRMPNALPLLRRYSAASPSNPPLTIETLPAPHTGLIKLLLLSRPAAKNALSKQLVSELTRFLAPIHSGEDLKTRALVIGSAVPGVFCAGADLKERRSMTRQDVDTFLADLRGLLKMLETLPIPTISAISGFALGGGLELALATDIRIVAPAAQLALPETRLGIIPGAGGTYRLPRLVGQSRALDIVLSGRRVGAIEAVHIGLANRIVDVGPDEEGRERTIDAAVEVAQEICTGAPQAVRIAKRVVIAEDEEAENRGYLEVVGTKDRNEALKAFAEKRKPVFSGL